jgi:hypothetical protein
VKRLVNKVKRLVNKVKRLICKVSRAIIVSVFFLCFVEIQILQGFRSILFFAVEVEKKKLKAKI